MLKFCAYEQKLRKRSTSVKISTLESAVKCQKTNVSFINVENYECCEDVFIAFAILFGNQAMQCRGREQYTG